MQLPVQYAVFVYKQEAQDEGWKTINAKTCKHS